MLDSQVMAGNIFERAYSYRDLRAIAKLTKSEADTWTAAGLIRSTPSEHPKRRIYSFGSLMEAALGKRLADFSSRMLLPQVMNALRQFLKRQRVDLERPDFSPRAGRKKLIAVSTVYSKEVRPGGGVRGVVPSVRWFDPDRYGPGVQLVIDLNSLAAQVISRAHDLASAENRGA